MSDTWLAYWKPDQIQSEIADGVVQHIASNQLKRVRRGDRVWICGLDEQGDLMTIGYIKVNRLITREQASLL